MNILAFLSLALNFLVIACFPSETQAQPIYNSSNQSISRPGIVGIRLNQNKYGEVYVVEVRANSPADKAGISVNDKLTEINGRSVIGKHLDAIYNQIKGPSGSNVTLGFYSKGKGIFKKSLTRMNPSTLGINPKTGKPLTSKVHGSTSSTTSSARNYKASRNTNSTAPEFKTTKPAHLTTPTEWLDYTNPSKTFSLKIPDSWEIKVDKDSGLIKVFSYDAESIKIYPFFLPGVRIDKGQTKSLFNALIKNQSGKVSWSNIERVGENGLKATCKDSSTKQIICLVVKNTKIGTAGRLFLAEAPIGFSKHYSEIFSKILSSLRFRPASQNNNTYTSNSQNQIHRITFRKFQDPKQGSFSLDVPSNWNTQGGTEQPGALDYRTWVRTISPDQSVVVFMGDGSIPTYTLPSFQLASLGFVPGSRYNPGGYNSIIAPYSPSSKFVKEYGFKSLKKVRMQNTQLVSCENQPRLAKEWNEQYRGLIDYGATSCRFTATNQSGDPVIGFFVGSTRRTSSNWKITYIGGVVCGAQKEQLGMNVFVRMFRSFKINPNWRSGQVANIGKSYQQITNFYTRFNQIQRQNFEARNRAREAWMRQASASLRDTSRSANNYSNHDEWMRQATNNIRDTEDVVDPNTGETYNIWSGSDYNYLHSDGSTILSTNTPIYPDVNWTQLTTLP